MKKSVSLILFIFVLACGAAYAQSSAFTYQGKLTDASLPANGQYDFLFSLYDSGGTFLVSGTIADVQVTDGIFTVNLDFGSPLFVANTANSLEIAVRPGASTGAYTTLTPRQPLTSAPYAVKSLNADTAATAGNVTGVVSVANGGTGSSTQNFVDLTSTQNIVGSKTFSGTLSGDVVNAATYNIAGNRILSAPAFNLFAGRGSGQANTSGNSNTFVGTDSGFNNTMGSNNSFFGSSTGGNNNSGSNNTLLGSIAGLSPGNLTYATAIGSGSFVTTINTIMLGRPADTVQVPGILNSALQYNIGGARVLSNAGTNNLFAGVGTQPAGGTGSNNTFIGALAGTANINGQFNTFVGAVSGGSNTTGNNNTLLGNGANLGASDLINATAIGSGAGVSQSNSLVLGNNVNVGIGVTSPLFKFQVNTGMDENLAVRPANVFSGSLTGIAIQSVNDANSLYKPLNLEGSQVTFNIGSGGNVGIGTANPTEKLHVGGNGNVRWANAMLSEQQGGSLELGGTNTIAGTGTSFIDFHFNGQTADYNARLINELPGLLALKGIFKTDNIIQVGDFGIGGAIPVCWDEQGVFSLCGSSLRYKQNVNPFVSGLSLIKQLRPVTFDWRSNGLADMGLVAEEVAKIEPLLTTTNKNGEIEGVKYDRVGVVLVNAVNEQQLQIEALQKQIDEQNETIKKQRADLDALKALVCSQNPAAVACKPQN